MSIEEKLFRNKVTLVNKELELTEPDSIETYDLGGKTFTGYRVQSVVDAVNNIFGNDWKYDILNQSDTEGKTHWVAVQIYFNIQGEWRYRGVQIGSGSAVGSDGDSRKAAISDALKKGFSLWSIGNKPYLGKLVAGEGMIIKNLNPLITEVLKKNDQLSEKLVKEEIVRFLKDKYKFGPTDLDGLPEEFRNFVMSELKERIKNMEKELV